MNCNLGLKNYLDSLNLGPRSKNEKKSRNSPIHC